MVCVLKAPSDTLAPALVWDSALCTPAHSKVLFLAWPGFCIPGEVWPRALVERGVGAPQVVVQGAGSLGSWSPVLFLEFQCLVWTEGGIVPAAGYVRPADGPRADCVCTWQLQGL